MSPKELNEWLAMIRLLRQVVAFCELLDGTAEPDREAIAKRAKELRAEAERYIK